MHDLSRRFLIAAIGKGLGGMMLGLYMGIEQEFLFVQVHVLVNLLGWVTLALYGLVYQVAPSLAAGRLPRLQFWLATVGPLLMCIGLAAYRSGMNAMFPLVPLGAVMAAGGMLVFGVIALSKPAARAAAANPRIADAVRPVAGDTPCHAG